MDFIIWELKLFWYFHLVGSKTFSRIRIRKKSFRIRAALDPKLIWNKTALKNMKKIWQFFNEKLNLRMLIPFVKKIPYAT